MKGFREFIVEANAFSPKNKQATRRYAKLKSALTKGATPGDAALSFAIPTAIGSAVGHPGIGAGVGAMAAAGRVMQNRNKWHRMDKIAKRLDRERKRTIAKAKKQ